MFSTQSEAVTAATNTLTIGTDDTDRRVGTVAAALGARLGATVVSASGVAPDAESPGTVLCTAAGVDVADDLAAALSQLGRAVLVVGPHCSGELMPGGPIVVPFDGSTRAGSIFPIARSWAHELDVPPVLAHMWTPSDALEHGSEIFDAVRVALAALGPSSSFEPVRTAYPPGGIRELAHELDASLIAMSSLGGDAMPEAVIGHVAARVVRESSCPVLLQRPIESHAD